MMKMNYYEYRDNSVNDTNGSVSLGMDPRAQQLGPGRNQVTARMKWTKEVNKLVTKCYIKRDPSLRGYRRRMWTL